MRVIRGAEVINIIPGWIVRPDFSRRLRTQHKEESRRSEGLRRSEWVPGSLRGLMGSEGVLGGMRGS